jgi:hypothetical protein
MPTSGSESAASSGGRKSWFTTDVEVEDQDRLGAIGQRPLDAAIVAAGEAQVAMVLDQVMSPSLRTSCGVPSSEPLSAT